MTAREINTIPCDVCNILIRYKADLPRHKRLHRTDKNDLMYKCPYNDCIYQTLQKSNLKTHMSKHSGTKPHKCPECEFTTGDPGSLTRHKKRIHDYVPNSSCKAKPTSTKQARRHAPYQRKRSPSVSSSSSSSTSTTSETSDPIFVISELPQEHTQHTYPWSKNAFALENIQDYSSPFTEEQFSSALPPQYMTPAFEACYQLANAGFSDYTQTTAFFDSEPAFLMDGLPGTPAHDYDTLSGLFGYDGGSVYTPLDETILQDSAFLRPETWMMDSTNTFATPCSQFSPSPSDVFDSLICTSTFSFHSPSLSPSSLSLNSFHESLVM